MVFVKHKGIKKVMANRKCCRCGHEGPSEEFLVTPIRGKVFCLNILECDEQAEEDADPNRKRKPLPDPSAMEIAMTTAKKAWEK